MADSSNEKPGQRNGNRPILIVGIYLIIAALAVFFVGHALTGLSWMYTADHYKLLVDARIINQDALSEYDGGRFATDPMAVPDYLVEGPVGYAGAFVNITTIGLLAPAGWLLVVAFRRRRGCAGEFGRDSEPA